MFEKFERRSQPVLSRRLFLRRLAKHGGYAAVLVITSTVVGVAGFHFAAHQASIDALLNTTMLLGGMGPVGDIQSAGGKIFASFFALYAGLVFIVVTALLTTPILHRLLHKFHI
jgi:hypothetical protein